MTLTAFVVGALDRAGRYDLAKRLRGSLVAA